MSNCLNVLLFTNGQRSRLQWLPLGKLKYNNIKIAVVYNNYVEDMYEWLLVCQIFFVYLHTVGGKTLPEP